MKKEIQQLTEDIQKLIVEINRLTDLITQANSNIESFQDRIKNLGELLVNMAEANKEDNAYYNQKIEDLGKLYNAFTQIIAKLNLLKGSSSAVNKYSHINATASELRDIAYRKAHQHQNASFVEVEETKEKKFMSFLQIAEQNTESSKMALKLAKQYSNFLETTLNADQAALEKLVSILQGIQDETLQKKSNAIEHLANINQKYNELKTHVEEEIKANQASLKAQIANRDLYVAQKQKAELSLIHI